MLSHKFKCIFIEVPKTGSSSIRSLLGKPLKPHLNICQMRSIMQHYPSYYRHSRNRLLASYYELVAPNKRMAKGEGEFGSYFKFGFVRNPWDRVVSLYLRTEGLQMRNEMSFDKFVSWIKYSSSTSKHPTPHVNQLDWLVDPHGQLLVDFIGRFENLENDWKTISKRINLPKALPHKNRNRAKNKHYTEYYTLTTKQIIQEKFKTDIEYFQYQFED